MNDIIQKAVNSIDDQAEKGGRLEQAIAQYIIDNCLDNIANADKALAKNKTLKGCVGAVTAKARKQATGSAAVVEDAVVWRWVREYYGFSQNTAVQSTAQPAAATVDILDFM